MLMLNTSYIITFHFEPVIDLWQRSKSINTFAQELNTSVMIDTNVNSELNSLLTNVHGNRAYVFRYHNGIPSSTNVPFVFHTNTHEVIRAGANRVINIGQRLPSSLISGMNVEFVQNRCITLRDIDHDINTANYWYYQTRSAMSMIRCPFFSDTGDLMGFVGVDYTNDSHDSELEVSLASIKTSAERLGKIFDRR